MASSNRSWGLATRARLARTVDTSRSAASRSMASISSSLVAKW